MSRGLAAGESARQLAKRPGRSPSTISREIARNGGRDRYRAASADAAAYERGRRPKQAELPQQPALRALVGPARVPPLPLTHLGEQGASLLMLMSKSRHKKPENVRPLLQAFTRGDRRTHRPARPRRHPPLNRRHPAG
ncbi:helix-turn-helix domain-containing protein [Streptomyces sp. NPDC059740]|uniref:helix-turn-helix domain-containing protein n=1 Tax=Streptomyces sp. NPDC059740 TaxID=3346926 RepID=UPI00365CC5C6